jgi:MYXO-CTERM domain-containing protein
MRIKRLLCAAMAAAAMSCGASSWAGHIISGSVNEIIVESRSGGQNFASYSEAGTWADSSSKSTAPGVTGGIGSRFSSNAFTGRSFTAAPDFGSGGLFEIFVTAAANMNVDQPITVVHSGGTDNFNADLSSGVTNAWKSIGTWTFGPGFGGSFTLASNGAGGSVIRGDAVLFAQLIPEPGTFVLAAAGVFGLALGRRRRSA